MKKECSFCGKKIKECGRLIRIFYFNHRIYACKSCRDFIRFKRKIKNMGVKV